MTDTTAPAASDVMLAILTLLVDEREARIADQPAGRRTELLLADAGLSNKAIAAMLGKKESAVRMAITRARTRDTK